jgi:hypothetical protein
VDGAADILVSMVLVTGGAEDFTVTYGLVEGGDDPSFGAAETGMMTTGVIEGFGEGFGVTSGSKDRPIPNSIPI